MKGKLLVCAAISMLAAVSMTSAATVKVYSRNFQHSGASTDVVASVSVTPADGVTSMDFVYSYNPSLVVPTGVFHTGFANNFSLTSNLGTPGTVEIHMAGPALTGSGDVVWVLFHVIGPAGNTSPLTWVSSSLNGGAIASTTTNGSVVIQSADAVISCSDAEKGAPATTVHLPISSTAFTGGGAFDLVIKFNPDVISAVSVAKTPLTNCFTLVTNTSTPGAVNIVLFGSCTVSGSGPLVIIDYNVVGAIGAQTPLNVVRGGINDGVPSTVLDDGFFTVCDALDGDGDGISGCAGDCNNGNPNVHPGAPEICDGLDDDCNGATPDGASEPWLNTPCDGADSDACLEGAFICQAGSQQCSDTTGNNLELCDGLDNDCRPSTLDGADEPWLGAPCDGADADFCPEGTFVCASGSQQCNDLTGDTFDTTCNGVDENCSGQADEGYVPVSTTCGVGACASSGVTSCSGGTVLDSCTPGSPSPETCDTVDNDCDGTVDNPAAPAGHPSLVLTAPTQLSWSAVANATAYDVVRGVVSVLESTNGDFTSATTGCAGNDVPSTSTSDGTVPALGDSVWYLVRPVNCGGPGSYDTGALSQVGLRDAEIAASAAPCP